MIDKQNRMLISDKKILRQDQSMSRHNGLLYLLPIAVLLPSGKGAITAPLYMSYFFTDPFLVNPRLPDHYVPHNALNEQGIRPLKTLNQKDCFIGTLNGVTEQLSTKEIGSTLSELCRVALRVRNHKVTKVPS